MTSPTNSPNLLSSYQMEDLSLKNRVVMPPMTRGRAGEERIPNALMAEYYSQRTNAGLIISEGTAPSKQGNGWVHAPGIYNDAQVEGWKQVTKAVRAKGTPFFLQLWHTGRASHSSFQENNQLPVAPSALKIEGAESHTPTGNQPCEVPRALETEEIPGIVEDYRQAAENAKKAGFDGVEVHAANGYLIAEFLQSKTNKRTDKYGGSLENRYRFLKEIVEAVMTVWPANRIGVRLSPNGSFNDMGSPDYKETYLYVAQQLNSYGLAYLHIMDGLAFGFHELGEPMTLAEFRAVFDNTIIGNCGYDREQAEQAIAAGDADLIAFGRPYISTPDLVSRFANNQALNPDAPIETWYSPGPVGYTDYPTYEKAQATVEAIASP
ncbi:alkene reductase [cf. Phormidesmis sp. LEGE 11477]|uniref:alkene reductase n=1 Tax=cf. Phormidesmis sp. LEGE 11477 TaxID=1828680 RepID=UPI0018813A85|nr:alkene reductase [cf. Phormidesmis sp. LEGE 11477]MBE9061643.1 alkene reductase [cf. Phormidesmis sp. LEGE 11477]